MNLSDFYTGSYGLITALFTAIFGMSFPLILQCIQRIDEKYDSSVISQVFEQELAYKLFQRLLFPYVVLVCASPLILGEIGANVGQAYAFQCVMLFYVLLIAVVMVFLFKRITVYYSIDKLVKSLKTDIPERDVLLCFDLAKFASKKGYQDVYIEAMIKVAECFIIERKQIEKNKPVEYSNGLYRVLLEIGRLLKIKDTEMDFRFCDIMSVILDSSDEHYISDKTYRHIWFMLNNAASYGNNQWIRDYWTWAAQYYEFKSNKVEEGRYNSDMKKFLLYNVMLGAVLSFNKRYECLAHIMKYTNLSNRYPLIPSTFRDIVYIAKRIDSMLDKPMEIEARFQIAGLDIGVNTDRAIFKEAIKYLAILFVRMWSYPYTNVDNCDPFEIPSPSETSIDENEANVRIMVLISDQITSFYNSDILDNLDFEFMPNLQDVTKLIDEFIEACNKKNEEINNRPGYDKEKLRHIYDEFVIRNSSSHIPFPSKAETGMRENTATFETVIVASHEVERRFLQTGRAIECGGIGNCLSHDLNLKIRQEFIDEILKVFDLKKETMDRSSLKNRLNELQKDSPKAIFDQNSGIDEIEGTTIYHLGKIWMDDAVFVCDLNCVPTLDILKGISGPASVETIDDYNYVYGYIHEEVDCYDVSVMQSISIEFVKGKPQGWLITIG